MKKMKKSKLALALVFALTSGALLAGCAGGAGSVGTAGTTGGDSPAVSDGEDTGSQSGESATSDGGSAAASDSGSTATAETEKPVVEITMENGGKIDIELDPDAAPITVANFLKLVDEGFYDGLTFHRIIPDFMIQGGDPDGNGTGGSDEEIKGEFPSNGWDNPISHKRGVISMARSNAPDSASSQFFITNADSEFLDPNYAAFGRVISGMDVVDEISATPTGANDAPKTPVVMQSIRKIA